MRSRKANPLKLLPSIESEAEPVKLPLFEGKQFLSFIPSGFEEMPWEALGFYRKAKSFGKIWKRAGEKHEENLSPGKGVLRFVFEVHLSAFSMFWKVV